MMTPFPQRTNKRGKKLGWFVLLWLGGVIGTVLIASVFKVLMLGAVKM